MKSQIFICLLFVQLLCITSICSAGRLSYLESGPIGYDPSKTYSESIQVSSNTLYIRPQQTADGKQPPAQRRRQKRDLP